MANLAKVYTSEINGKDVLLNLDTEHFAWVHTPTGFEVEETIAYWERARLAAVWKELEKPARGASGKLLKGHITGFAATPAGSLRYFRAEVVKDAFGIKLSAMQPLAPLIRELGVERQLEVLRSLQPSNLSELRKLFGVHAIKAWFPCDLRNYLVNAGSIAALITIIEQQLADNTVPAHHSESYRELLMVLRARGYLMFPAVYDEFLAGGNVRWTPFLQQAYAGQLYPVFEEVARNLTLKGGTRSDKTGIGLTMLAATSAVTFEDFSRDLIEALEELFIGVQINKQVDTSYARRRPAAIRSTAEAFRKIWNRLYPARGYETTRKRPPGKAEETKRTRGEFKWVSIARPEMNAWVEPLATFITERKGGKIKQGPISNLNTFMDFLIAHDTPPARPEDVVRPVHIHDPTLKNSKTLMMMLRTSHVVPKSQYRVLKVAREFFQWYPDWLISQGLPEAAKRFRSPITENDTIHYDQSSGGTHRMALPSWLLNELRRTLTEDDFAVPKSVSSHDWVPVWDNELQRTVRVWWPGPALCLAIMLDLPLRSHQGRWLDSGEFDEYRLDCDSRQLVKNPHPKAIPGRREQALRLIKDVMLAGEWITLYVNTNKTALFNSRSPNGYEIPWVSTRTIEMLQRMETWNRRYSPPLVSLVTYMNSGGEKAKFSKVASELLPKVAPLFRDPRLPQANTPVSHSKLARLWVKVLHETEKRVRVKWNVPDLELTKLDEKGKRTWKFDLHTLRVSGISAMLENGVPLEVVSQFVAGHATLVMTLWYAKFAPAKIRQILEKASILAQDDADFVGDQTFAEHVEEFSPFLLSKDFAERDNYDPAFESLKQHTGLWTINTDGICPGTSCSTGGDWLPGAAEYGPVPGGRRCGLCRYWITGPAFLLGQMANVNNLAYEIRKKGQALSEARERLIDAEDAGQRTKMRLIRDSIEEMERNLSLDISEWQARYQYASKSSEMMGSYKGEHARFSESGANPVQLMTANSAQELQATLIEADEYLLLEHITQMAEFMPNCRNSNAMQDKHVLLSQLLAANGIPAKYLVTLSGAKRDLAANLLSSTLLQFLEAHDMRRLVNGELLLNDVPGLEAAVRELAAPETLRRNQASRVKVTPLKET